MVKISKKQALKRWDTLPDNLKDAIFSGYNAEILWHTCENQHLSEDKIGKVAVAAGDVLMGFVHPEDFASEIREALNINIEIANAISMEINRKIFYQFKNDLEKIYQPAVSDFDELEELGEEEKSPVLDLRKKIEETSFKIVEDENQKQENKIDLSKMPQREPIAEKIMPVVKEAAPVAEKTEEEKKIEEPKIESASISFETPAPMLPAGPSGENGPLIIHEEVGFKPLSGKLKSLGGMFNFLRGGEGFKKEEGPVKANLEIGEEFKITEEPKAEKPKIEIKPEPAVKEIKVVNYGEEPAIAELMPGNLPVVKEEIMEVKPEVELKTEQKNKPEETIDLGMFK